MDYKFHHFGLFIILSNTLLVMDICMGLTLSLIMLICHYVYLIFSRFIVVDNNEYDVNFIFNTISNHILFVIDIFSHCFVFIFVCLSIPNAPSIGDFLLYGICSIFIVGLLIVVITRSTRSIKIFAWI